MYAEAAYFAARSKFYMDSDWRLVILSTTSTSDSSYEWAQRRNITKEIIVEQPLQNEISDGDPPEGKRFNHDR